MASWIARTGMLPRREQQCSVLINTSILKIVYLPWVHVLLSDV